MKKLFSVLLVSLFVVLFAMPVFAGDSPALPNYQIFGATGGATGVSPATEVVKVRYGRMGPNIRSLTSGDVVSWDIVSKDGVTISLCTVSQDSNFAGVLVTDIASAENTATIGGSRNWGYMAIRGYCLASVDTTGSATGGALYPMSQGRFGTVTGAYYPPISTVGVISLDIGSLLNNTGTLGLMPVMLR